MIAIASICSISLCFSCYPPACTQVDVKLQRLLGVGAAGCVYEAEWEGRQVAVKLMHPSSADQGAFSRCGAGSAGMEGLLPDIDSCRSRCLPSLTSAHRCVPNTVQGG